MINYCITDNFSILLTGISCIPNCVQNHNGEFGIYYWSQIQSTQDRTVFKKMLGLKFHISIQVFKLKKGVLQKENCNICTIYSCLLFQMCGIARLLQLMD